MKLNLAPPRLPTVEELKSWAEYQAEIENDSRSDRIDEILRLRNSYSFSVFDNGLEKVMIIHEISGLRVMRLCWDKTGSLSSKASGTMNPLGDAGGFRAGLILLLLNDFLIPVEESGLDKDQLQFVKKSLGKSLSEMSTADLVSMTKTSYSVEIEEDDFYKKDLASGVNPEDAFASWVIRVTSECPKLAV